MVQKKHLVVRSIWYQVIAGQLYKMVVDQVLCHCILDHEGVGVLWKYHSGVARVHLGGKATTEKFLQVGLW